MSNVIPSKREADPLINVHLLCYMQDWVEACSMSLRLEEEMGVKVTPVICDPESIEPGQVVMCRYYADRMEHCSLDIEESDDE